METNLAGNIARQGDDYVFLLDADWRRAAICDSRGLAHSGGLLDLAGSSS